MLEGTVRELDGGPLARVEIRARRTETNELLVLETDASGLYGWDGLPVGDYEVLASKDGFDSQRRMPVRLQVGQRVRLDFRLRTSPPGEASKIEGDLSRLTVERDDVGQLIDRKQLRNMPSKERNFTDLVTLAPGAVSRGTRRIQVLGMSWRDNLTYFDGTLITGGDGSTNMTPSSEAIREFDVKTGLYSAQYGIRSGGQVLLVSRHGGNRFHGGLFWFHRNDNLDARNYFEQRKAEFKRNQMGGTLGGPLILPGLNRNRDSAWFFISYLHYTIRETLPLTAVVPTPEQREGRFAGAILDPVTGNPFPDNRIPAHRIDPVTRQLLSFYPLPNTAGPLNFTSPDSKRPHDNRQVIARVDLRTSSSSSWAFRFAGRSTAHDPVQSFQRLHNPDAARELQPSHHQHPEALGRIGQLFRSALVPETLHGRGGPAQDRGREAVGNPPTVGDGDRPRRHSPGVDPGIYGLRGSPADRTGHRRELAGERRSGTSTRAPLVPDGRGVPAELQFLRPARAVPLRFLRSLHRERRLPTSSWVTRPGPCWEARNAGAVITRTASTATCRTVGASRRRWL